MITAEAAHRLGIKFSFAEYQTKKDDYQEYGEQFLLMRKHAFLYYEPGKGKTYPAVEALRQCTTDTDDVLILSTADSVKNMWNAEIVPQEILPKRTTIMSFTQAIQDVTSFKLQSTKWKVIIIDESHKIKAHNTKISKLVYKLTKKVPYAWGLSGTPRGNSDLDIFCQFHNMNVSEWGTISYTQFVNTCCDVDVQYGPYGKFLKVLGINERYKAGWERNLEMHTQRVSYEEGEMPPLNIKPVVLKYTPTKYYKNALEGVLMVNDYETTMAKLSAVSKAYQASNGFVYYTPDDERQIEVFEHNKKLDYLKEHVKPNEPTTVVYLFKHDCVELQKIFPDSTENIADFKKGKSNLLLLQCSRCESFNLQNCSTMYFYTMDYSYIKFKQMLHRVWRRGQESDTNINVLLFDNEVEKQIWRAVSTKKKLADLFMGIKGSTNGREFSKA